MAESGGTFWAAGFWADGFWADGFWAGVAVTEPSTTGGGQRYGRPNRRLAPYKTEGKVVPVGDSLYRQMFPDKQQSLEQKSEGVPVALLIAWMAGFDE